MGTISESLAQWVKDTYWDNIPVGVAEIGKRSILDWFGVTLAGSRESIAQIVKKYLGEVGGARQSTVVGFGAKTSCTEAAFANGLLGHCLDYDDVLITTVGGGGGHITTALFPAVLALAEKENKSGKELVEAYILGCEVAAKVSGGIDPEHYLIGWHATATEGILGAAAASGKLLGLNQSEIANALGIAASEASGLRENFGTKTKPFHAGQAAAKGVKAALLAKLGLDSSRTIFEGKHGFCNALSKNARPESIARNLGKPFCLPQVRLKLYSCCACSHSAIYSALKLVKQYGIRAEDVAEVEVQTDPLAPAVLVYGNPKTAFEGKFSIQFPIALAIVDKKVTLPQFTDEKIREPQIISLMQKIKLTSTPDLIMESPAAMPAVVKIRLKNGRELKDRCDYPPGTAENPLSEEEVLQKYRTCASSVLPERETEKSIDLITHLEKVDNISELMSLFRTSRKR